MLSINQLLYNCDGIIQATGLKHPSARQPSLRKQSNQKRLLPLLRASRAFLRESRDGKGNPGSAQHGGLDAHTPCAGSEQPLESQRYREYKLAGLSAHLGYATRPTDPMRRPSRDRTGPDPPSFPGPASGWSDFMIPR